MPKWQGRKVEIKGKPINFSYWPMHKGYRRYGLQNAVYVTNPLSIIRDAIQGQCAASCRDEAQAYVSQAEYFLRSVNTSSEYAAKPLLLYYCFMNLAKAYILTRKIRVALDKGTHGLSEKLDVGGREFSDAYLGASATKPTRISIFSDFMLALTDSSLSISNRYNLEAIVPQLVIGHRLWARAMKQKERFVAIKEIVIAEDKSNKELRLVLQIYSSNLSQHDISHGQLLQDAGIANDFYEIEPCIDSANGEALIQFRQKRSTKYSHRPSDEIPALINAFRCNLWCAVNNANPFRQYYLYMAPLSERAMLLPQLGSIYALAFYLGSITRYRPHHFAKIISGEMGGFFQEYLTSQQSQFLYILASEFAKQEVTKSSII